MNSAVVIANPEAPIRKYELGRPIVRREERAAFERIHRGVAQTWTDWMAQYLPPGAAVEFEGLDFDTFSSVATEENPCAQVALFSIASTPISGFLLMSGALAKFLVSARLGLKSTAENVSELFTRIEASIARATTRAMLAHLGDAYASAGLGSIGDIRECDNLVDSFVFAPEESVALVRFRISSPSDELHLLIGLSGNIISAISGHPPADAAKSNSRSAIVDAASQLPIEVDVVLGRWKVPPEELLQLRTGDRIVLPDGGDAWLSARGVRIRRAIVEITPAGASVEIAPNARMR
jgi:flagellar motor switch protein FliM